MLNVFLGRKPFPNYRLVQPTSGQLEKIIVKEEVSGLYRSSRRYSCLIRGSWQTTKIRPYVAGAILRGVKFDEARYQSFIGLQDKLHQNIARQRTLVSIGTHDLDTIEGPFTYEALPPKEIRFTPLNQTKEMNGEELMAFYDVGYVMISLYHKLLTCLEFIER